MKSLVAIFDSNNKTQDDNSLMKKKNETKIKINFLEYAKEKQYLHEGNSQD